MMFCSVTLISIIPLMDNDADWVHHLNKFLAHPTNLF